MKQISFKVDEKIRLDEFLIKKNISRNLFLKLYKNNIFIDNSHAKRNSKLSVGNTVTLILEDEENNYEPKNLDIEIMYEDDWILILNKPVNLTMNTDGEISLANFVAYLFEKENIKQKVRFINRLDMDTSGLVMVAKNNIAQAYYQKMGFKKKYIAVVKGNPKDGEIAININRDSKKSNVSEFGKKSITIVKKIEQIKDYSIVELELLTGRTHQIRVSMEYINCPIVGDKLYGNSTEQIPQLLHAREIEFFDMEGKNHIIETEIPERFSKFLNTI